MEFRKLISFGKSSYVVSLPKNWIEKNRIAKGGIISIEELDGNLLLSAREPENQDKRKTIEIKIDKIDRTSLLHIIRSTYKRGYDDIKLVYTTSTVPHYRLSRQINIISIIHEEVNRLIGMEVVEQKDNYCVLKNLSEISAAEFESTLRRVFLLLVDASKDLVTAIENKDDALLETIEEKHDSIMKFISYCLRLINKGRYKDYKRGYILYHILSEIDKITDIIKYCGRSILSEGNKLKPQTVVSIKKIMRSVQIYYEMFYKFEITKATEIYHMRDEVIKEIVELRKKVPASELQLVEKTFALMELITDLSESRIALEYD